MKADTKKVEIKTENLPSINLERQTYKSSTMTIITDRPLQNKDNFGFPRDDVPDYAKIE